MPRASRFAAAAVLATALCVQQLVGASGASADTVTVTDWPSLQAAFLAGGPITLGANVDSSGQSDPHLVVGTGVPVSLDLNGYGLSVTVGSNDGSNDVAAITVPSAAGTSLTISDSSADGTGSLSAEGNSSGIGGDLDQPGGDVTITGGYVDASGANGTGIGSGDPSGSQFTADGSYHVDGGSLTVTGGDLEASSSSWGSAAIGGGICASGAAFTQTGGYVDAENYSTGAGIGSGANLCVNDYNSPDTPLSGGSVSVSGGTLDATGGDQSAAIGGGSGGSSAAVTVTGGSVSAENRQYGVAFGNGQDALVTGGPLVISGGTVTATTNNSGSGYPWPTIGGVNAPGIDTQVAAGGTLDVYSNTDQSFGAGADGQAWGSLSNAGTLSLDYDNPLTVPADVTIHNSGLLMIGGTLSGAGTVDNTGIILPQYVGYQYGGNVVNDGQGAPGATVTHHNYRLTYDTNGGPDAAPGRSVVFAGTVADAGQGLPTVSAPAGKTFHGWFTAATGGTAVTSTTDLATVFGSGPVDQTLYAHYLAPQAISFTSSAPSAAPVGNTYDVSATATSGRPVNFSVGSGTSNNACAVSGSTVSFKHVGTCVVAADQAGDDDSYQPAPQITQSITVGKGSQVITATSTTPANAGVGGTYTPAATAPAGPVTVSTTGSACSLSQGVVHFDHPGSCTVNFDQAGGTDYDAAPQLQQTFTISAIGSSVAVTTDPVSTVYGQTAHASATVTVSSGTPAGTVQFSVDGTAIGTPTALVNGSATSPALVDADGHALSTASHSVGATFVPTSGDYAGATNSVSHVVSRAASTTTITRSAQSLTATVSPVAPGAGTPTGTVTFTVGGTTFGTATLVDGTATLAKAVAAGESREVAAVYAGDDAFTGSSDSASATVRNPSVTATVTGSPAGPRGGWYRGSVTVRFRCAAASARLTAACPAPVVLRHEGAAQSVTRTVLATDGGAKTVVVRGINIDHTAPSVALRGARRGGVYRGTAPRVRCAGTDRLAGVASCKVTQRSRTIAAGRVVRYTVTATDRAGNRRTTTGRYTVLTRYVDGAAYRNGAFQVKAGRSYTLVVTGSGHRPVYYDAAVAPRRPHGRDRAFHYARHSASTGTWTLGLFMDRRMRSHRNWNIGVKIGATMRVLKVKVTNAG